MLTRFINIGSSFPSSRWPDFPPGWKELSPGQSAVQADRPAGHHPPEGNSRHTTASLVLNFLFQELKDINQSISGGNSSTADQIWSQNTEATAIKTEETLQDLSTEVVVFFQTFESFPTEDSFIEDDVNNSNNSNIYISLLISIILLLFLTAIILILLKCRVFKRRTTGFKIM